MKRFQHTIAVLACLVVFLSQALGGTPKHSFTIYAFIPWQEHLENGKLSRSNLADYLEKQGIHPIKVIYDFMSNDRPDPKKIKAVAVEALKRPDIPVSFDTEFGDRHKPATVIPGVLEILRLFRKYDQRNPVGVYATVPQNTYGWKPGIAQYDSLNARYREVADKVDFLSPILYNYNGDDREAWKKAAKYNIQAAQHYGTGKPILPYVAPMFGEKKGKTGNGGQWDQFLDEGGMRERLEVLYNLGASGCILWTSSGAKGTDGQQPVVDLEKGWGRGVVLFLKSHPSN